MFRTEDAPPMDKGFYDALTKMSFCGEAGLGPAVNSNPAPQFAKRFQMRHGLGVMPSFTKEVISKKDLHDISKYLKRWKAY
jgi:hypothetical protein